MTTRRIGDVVVTRVEEALRPGFEPAQLLARWDPALLEEHRDWLAPHYYDPASGRFMSSIHCRSAISSCNSGTPMAPW